MTHDYAIRSYLLGKSNGHVFICGGGDYSAAGASDICYIFVNETNTWDVFASSLSVPRRAAVFVQINENDFWVAGNGVDTFSRKCMACHTNNSKYVYWCIS